jgi:hypothetical protein
MSHKCVETVEEWNKQVPVGTEVVVMKDFSDKATLTKTRSKASMMCGEPVVWLEGISGSYALTHVYQQEQNNDRT